VDRQERGFLLHEDCASRKYGNAYDNNVNEKSTRVSECNRNFVFFFRQSDENVLKAFA